MVDGDNKYEGDIVIPAEITYNSRNLKVTSIGGSTFSGCSLLSSISLSNSVISIGRFAFSGCSSLSSVIIPNSVISIGKSAFKDCSSLTNITIPNSVTSIEESTFENCSSLTNVIIPNSVTSIDRKSFFRCSALANITIPNSVISIGEYAFSYCSSLASISLPNAVLSIGKYAFSNCSSLASISLPNSLTSIEGYTFSKCSSLTSVSLPTSLISIGEYVFSNCSSLETIKIPNSVISIGKCTFSGCSLLEHIKFSKALKRIEYGLFSGCAKLATLEIPGSVTEISQYYSELNKPSIDTFDDVSLSQLRLMYSSQRLILGYNRADSFESSQWVESWPREIKVLYIDRLLNDEIPVPNLVKLEIGESLKNVSLIEGRNWGNISSIASLDTIISYAKEPPTLPTMKNKQYMDMIVKVPADALEAYKTADSWKNFWNLSALDPDESGVNEIKSESAPKEIVRRYDINGNKVDENYNGIVIVRFSDGSVRKMINNAGW
ncbi:MAG: leucine-rich repeat domain-containing protein [Muribaculaceae bacterium]|nr:leucine-rich repeat domain-containing protein [Muribaculaceae bacterium]